MSAMQEWETRTVIRVECYRCDGEFFLPRDSKPNLNECPYCGNESIDVGGDGLGVQNRTFEVSA